MGWIERIFRRSAAVPNPVVKRIQRRQSVPVSERLLFQAAQYDQFNADWLTSSVSINDALYWNLRALRARSREMAANNPYFKRWLSQAKNNVIGRAAIRFQSRAIGRDGNIDLPDNSRLEKHFSSWSKRGSFDVTGRMSRWSMERMLVEGLLRDGEFILRLWPGYPNSFGYAVQILDPDRLDIDYNDVVPETGNTVTMGVEQDDFGKPVAYHLLLVHPDQLLNRRPEGLAAQERIRIPAELIVHGYIGVRPEQARGIPAAHAAMLALRDLGEYRASALINARRGANKLGWWRLPNGAEAPEGHLDDDGMPLDSEGMGEIGKIFDDEAEFVSYDPTYPHGEFPEFNKAMLQGIAAGLDNFYPTMNHDYAGVNLSSIRGGLLDEREGWRAIQFHLVEQLHEALYPRWLLHQLGTGRLAPIPTDRFDKFALTSVWKPRGWKSPDPIKDAQADAIRFGMGVRSLRDIVEDDGGDFEETLAAIAAERAQLKAFGIPITLPQFLKLEEEPTADSTPEEDANAEE